MRFLKPLIGMLLYPVRLLLAVLLALFMPVHGKRILFITSVYLHVTNTRRPETSTLAKLNEAMRLAQDVEALLLPAYLYQLVWNERLDQALGEAYGKNLLSEPVDPLQTLQACTEFVRSVPRWLHYGTYSDMVQDVAKVFENARRHHNATTACAA